MNPTLADSPAGKNCKPPGSPQGINPAPSTLKTHAARRLRVKIGGLSGIRPKEPTSAPRPAANPTIGKGPAGFGRVRPNELPGPRMVWASTGYPLSRESEGL